MGRKQSYPEKIYDAIIEQISAGKTLREVCRQAGYPTPQTVRHRVNNDAAYAERYAQARYFLLEHMADEMLAIADDTGGVVIDENGEPDTARAFEDTNRARLRVDTRKWLLSKLLPSIYGDIRKVDTSVTGNVTMTHTVDAPPKETREQWIARRKREICIDVEPATGAASRRDRGDLVS